MVDWFNSRKAAQVATFFAIKEGGRINVLKLMKLIYLSDRKNMDKYDYPILSDILVSMPHGPVNSCTLDHINGEGDQSVWVQFLADKENHEISAVNVIEPENMDQLSRAEIKTLDQIWDEFGKMDRYQLRDWTHDNCPEWEDPKGSSASIPYERIFKFLGKKNPEELQEEIKFDRRISKLHKSVA